MSYRLRKEKKSLQTPTDYKDTLASLRKVFEGMDSRNGKPLSKLTIDTYLAKIQRLHSAVTGEPINSESITNLSWLSDPEKVVKSLIDSGLSALKDYVSPVVRLLKHQGAEQGVIDAYSKALNGFKSDEDKVRATNQVKPEMVEKFIPYKDVCDKLDEKIKNMAKMEDDELVYLLICVFYYLSDLIPRNDLNILKFKGKDKVNKSSPDFNYVSTHKVGAKIVPVGLVWNNYKTRDSYGQKKFGITKELSKVLVEYIRRWGKLNDDFVFTDKNNKPFTKSNMGDLLRSATQHILGERQSVNLIRRTIISDFKDTPHTIQEEDAMANRFLHSASKQREYFSAQFSKNYKKPKERDDDSGDED